MIHKSLAALLVLAHFTLGAFVASAATLTLDIEASIDGRDQLIIRDGTLQWQHFDFGAVGRWDHRDQPTIISASLDGVPVLDRFEWFPQWSYPAPIRIEEPEKSSIFTGLPSVAGLGSVSLEAVQARWELSVLRRPTPANFYTTVVEFDDAQGGADWYHARLTFETGSPPPPPLAWEIDATVTEIGDPDGIFTSVEVGDRVRGFLRYDVTTPPTIADANNVHYEHDSSFEVAKMLILNPREGGELTIGADQSQLPFVGVLNDQVDPESGLYDAVSAYQPVTPPQGFGGTLPVVNVALTGSAGVLDDASLPTALDLSDWSDAFIVFADLIELVNGEPARYIYARIDSLKPVALTTPGDYDADGDVDGSDFLVWQRTLGFWHKLAADGDGSGIIDAQDLALWKNHFGFGGTTSGASAVPEPGGALLLCVAMWAAIQRPRLARRVRNATRTKLARCNTRPLRLESLESRQMLSGSPPTIAVSDASAVEGSTTAKYLETLVAPASGGLQNARGFDFGPDGNIYVSAERHWEDPVQLGWVNRYDGATGRFLGQFASHPSMTGAKDVEFGPDGNLYVPNNVGHNIYRFNGQTGAFLDVFVPTGLGGLNTPRSIIFGPDASGDGVPDAYVSSAVTDSILRYDTITGAFLGAFVPTGSGGLNDPTALVFGPNGDLFVASGAHSDYYNSILRYDGRTGAFKGVFVAAGSAGLTLAPTAGVIFGPDANNDGAQDMYVSNGVGDEVLIYNGTTGAFLQKYITPALGGLNDPKGLLFDAGGNLLVISNYNSILRFGKSSQAAFTVSLSEASAAPVAVNYATASGAAAAGSDFTPVAGTIVFQPGETTRTILVRTLDDAHYESAESFSLVLSSPVGATIADAQGVATIADNDPAPTKFYVVDDGLLQNRTHEYNPAGAAVEDYSLNSGNATPRGVATTIAGDKVWVVDANRKVYVYNTSGGLLGSWTAGTMAASAAPEDIATNGTDVWIVDAQSDKVFRYAAGAARLSGSQNASSSFNLNSSNLDPKGIVTDGAHLWVVNDSSTDKVFKYTLSGALVGSWTISSANSKPTGLTIDPANVSDIWIVDAGTDRVYQYAAAAGRTSGSQSAIASFALASGNTNPQGIADPPPGAVHRDVLMATSHNLPSIDAGLAAWSRAPHQVGTPTGSKSRVAGKHTRGTAIGPVVPFPSTPTARGALPAESSRDVFFANHDLHDRDDGSRSGGDSHDFAIDLDEAFNRT